MALTQIKSEAIADDAITLAKQAAGTDGQIITYDASGNPAAVGPGTDGQVLTSTGAGSPPAFEALPASGPSLSGSTNNTVVTVTGSNAMQGEASLIFDGSTLDVTGAGAFTGQLTAGTVYSSGDGVSAFGGGSVYIRQDGIAAGGQIFTCLKGGTADGNRLAAIFGNGGALFAGPISANAGIDFSAQTSTSATGATTTSELLDHYEEGTWTPNVGGNATYTVQLGDYTRIGRSVTIRGDILINTLGTGSDITLDGLPFVVLANSVDGAGATNYCSGLAVSIGALSCYAKQNTDNVYFTTWGSGGSTGVSAIDAAIFQDSARVQFAITYITS